MMFEWKNQRKVNERFVTFIEKNEGGKSIIFNLLPGIKIQDGVALSYSQNTEVWVFETEAEMNKCWSEVTLTEMDKIQKKLVAPISQMSGAIEQLSFSESGKSCVVCGKGAKLDENGVCESCS